MIAVKFIVWVLLNLFFVIFVAIPGVAMVFIMAPVYFAWLTVTSWLPGFMNNVDEWLD